MPNPEPGRPLGPLNPRPAFTLVELMVVIVLIGLLAGAVSLGVRGYLITGKQNIAKMEIAKIGQALETFYTAYDRFPGNDEGLQALVQPSDKFADGILNKTPRDPWGHAYQYNQPGHSGPYDIVSYGADGHEGGEGADRDITNEDGQVSSNSRRACLAEPMADPRPSTRATWLHSYDKIVDPAKASRLANVTTNRLSGCAGGRRPSTRVPPAEQATPHDRRCLLARGATPKSA